MMLSENSGKNMSGTNQQNTMTPESLEIDALKASYWAAVAASAHAVFSEPATANFSSEKPERSLSAKLTAQSSFASSALSQWLPVPKPDTLAPATQSLSLPSSFPKSHLNADLPDIERATLNPHREQKIGEQKASSQADSVRSFLDQLDAVKANKAALQDRITGSPLPSNQTEQPDPLDWVEMSERLDQGFLDNESLLVKDHWTSKLLNSPRMVAALIVLCLLGSTIYAGLGYWWLTSISLSHAAEPEPGKPSVRSGNHDLLNIKTLQEQLPKQQPAGTFNPDERLIAQATPAEGFSRVESADSIPGLSGRPDPFSPLIQETNGVFIAPAENQDALTGVQYTGFIGGANSKSKIAIIKVADVNPAIPPKTLFKKAGESFYVNGERIYLRAIGKTGLSLQLNGENRTLSLNPYKVVVNNTNTNAAGAAGSNAGSTGVAGNALGGSALGVNSSVSNLGGAGSSASAANPYALETANTNTTTNTTTNAARNEATMGNTVSSPGNGIYINLEQ
jgi:hypothetical protein